MDKKNYINRLKNIINDLEGYKDSDLDKLEIYMDEEDTNIKYYWNRP